MLLMARSTTTSSWGLRSTGRTSSRIAFSKAFLSKGSLRRRLQVRPLDPVQHGGEIEAGRRPVVDDLEQVGAADDLVEAAVAEPGEDFADVLGDVAQIADHLVDGADKVGAQMPDPGWRRRPCSG